MKPLIAPSTRSEKFITLARPLVARRDFFGLLTAASLFGLAGCTTPAVRSQSPEDHLSVETQTKLVGDLASPFGMNWIKVEQVALLTGLAGTGSDPAPSPNRSALIGEMQVRGVPNPSQILNSTNNSLVLLRAFIPPGVQKGDHFDVDVRLAPQSETTSLKYGWLMDARLIETAVLSDGQVHDGHTWGHAEGALLVDPMAESNDDKGLLTHAKVLGGGTATRERKLGLVISGDQKSIRSSAQIGAALNKRFHTYSHGTKQGIATPKTDEYIELAVLSRYKNNLARYMRVVRSVALQETETLRVQRLRILEQQLLDPVSAANAALKLEAIGNDAIKVLAKGMQSNDLEVRFYAAEALAYLDYADAAKVLADTARNEPVFRAWAFTALSAMDDSNAVEALKELFDANSAETRYGAFRSLWAINPKEPIIRGENLKGQFSYHLIASPAAPMVHVTKSVRPEIVLFGADQRMRTPIALEAGNKIVIKSLDSDQIVVSHFSADESDQKRIVSTKLDDVIRATVELGGTYPDVVQMLQQAKTQNALEGRFEVEALPDQRRLFDRLVDELAENQKDKSAAQRKGVSVASPLGELFGRGTPNTGSSEQPPHSDVNKKPVSTEKNPGL